MKSLIKTFYSAFQKQDASTMISCYHNDVVFHDPIFGELKGDDVKAMWTMLCKNAKDLKIEFSNIQASLKKGSVHWEAWYTFSKTAKAYIILLRQILNLKIQKLLIILIISICINGLPRL